MLTKKITTAIVTISTIALAVTPTFAFADTQVGQVLNGAFSTNQATVTTTNSNTAVQNNTANISNNVNTSSNTGGNEANFTTGGSADITTGAAINNTEIVNKANENQFTGMGCPCDNSTQVLQSENGAFSQSNAAVSSSNDNQLFQTNNATFNNTVNSQSNSGDNTANDTTGGDSTIIAGPSQNATGIFNSANKNVAVTGNTAGGAGGLFGTDLEQTKNGAFATDTIDVAKTNSNLLDQTNSAAIDNSVHSDSSAGNNAADFTTGGTAFIGVQGASNATDIVNNANLNVAAFQSPCGCDGTNFLKQGINGAYSVNGITTTSSNDNSLFQNNDSSVYNDVYTKGTSGANSASFSTGGFGLSDPTIIAGPSNTSTGVDTEVNKNVAGSGISLAGWDVQFNWTNPFAMLFN